MSDVRPLPPITDSPWYWLYLFCTAGLVALVIMGPKFAARQAQIERKSEARQRAALQVSGETPMATDSEAEATAINLQPLYLILAIGLGFAWLRLWQHRRHLRANHRPETSS